MKNNKRNFIIVLCLSIIILYLAFKDDFSSKVKYLFSFDINWLICSFVLMIAYWILKGIVLYYCTKDLNEKYTIKQGIHLMITTQFFNAITPFATGGQPWQIYRLKKSGLSLGESTTVVIEDFIAYQIALVLLGIIAVISNHTFNILPQDSVLRHLVTIGFIINTLVIIVLFLVAFSKNWNKKIIGGTIKILYKIKIVKDRKKMLDKSEKFIENFHKSASTLLENKLNYIRLITLNFIALCLLYLIPFTLMQGLDIYVNPFIIVITSAYVMLIGGVVPIPGGTGGLEYSFMSFFKNFIIGPKLSIIIIVWRIVTYYFGIIIGIIAINIHKEEGK